ncbi:CHASE domain-containing protein [Massilia sp. 9096]|uniref:sensor histidine kinase n=1 Tax=Massilia sp. 9096 TaxID=1500894 RepID=UPI00068C7489|nr:CHASE domain-containing protein [Massilia sp. 9096]
MSTLLRDAFLITRLSFWTGVLLSSVIGGLAYVVMDRSIESDARQRFVNDAAYAQNVIALRVKSYTDLLRRTASMIQSSHNFSHRQFHEYVCRLDLKKHYPAFDNFNVAVYVTDEEKQAFVTRLRQDMQAFTHSTEPLDITPRGIRPAYLVVYYIEPDLFSPGHYGVDLMANLSFGDQLRIERDEGTVQAAGTPIPPLSRPNDAHLGMRIAVYRPGAAHDTVEQRRAAYIGSLGIAFSLPKLLHGVLDEMPISGVRMTLFNVGPRLDYDGHPIKYVQTLFDSRGSAANPKPALDSGDDTFSVTLPINFNGRLWKTVYSVPKSALYTEFDIYYPKLIMVFGFIGTMLLYALLHTLTSSRRAALQLAQEMTSELRASQNKLQLSHQKLRRLADHAYQIKELERKRIAREIHDDLGQNLLALRIEAEILASRTGPTHRILHARARATLQQIDTIIKSVRQIINDLRPTVLDLGLSAAVEWQVDQFQRRTGIQCEVRDDHGEIELPDHCATAFFRILQESLTNVVRHAHATKVVVELRLSAGWLSMSVKDNGCGLPPGVRNKFGSFGLVGIEERIVILGGTCAVFSEPGAGTTVIVSAPVVDSPPYSLSLQQAHSAGSAVI